MDRRAKSRWLLALFLAAPLALLAGEGILVSRHAFQREKPASEASSLASFLLKDLVAEEKTPGTPLKPPSPAPMDSAANTVAPACPAQPVAIVEGNGYDAKKLARLEQALQSERDSHERDARAAEAERAKLVALVASLQQALTDAQNQSASFGRALNDARNQVTELQRKAESSTKPGPPVAPPPPPLYASSGVIVWQGQVRGTQLVEIQDDVASVGAASGKLPGVACFIQSSDPKRVVITDPPRPSNGFRRLVFQVKGNGPVTIRFSWVVQK